MRKNRWDAVWDYVIRNCKIIFPVLLIIIVALTVVIALGAVKDKGEGENSIAGNSSGEEESSESVVEPVQEDVPLVANENEELYTLIETYYNAMAQGDTETILSVCSEYSENELLRLQERAKYMDHYSALDIYTKPGPEEGSVIAYVNYKLVFNNYEEELPGFQAWYICTDEQGKLYIHTGELSEDVDAYIKAVSKQADVVECYNRVNVAYNEVVTANPELLKYMEELSAQVNMAVGTVLAQENGQGGAGEAGNPEGSESKSGEDGEPQSQEPEAPVEPSGPQYATATTTVNVRSSDSEQADKLGKVSGGTKIEVQEVRVNGWTKVVFEGKDGYIKSEYLQMVENASNQTAIGTVTAIEAVNARSGPSETAERLGVVAEGASLELLGNENGWCKVNYEGQVAYVKAEYVQQQ